jgi:hypothetical protein
MSVDAEDGLAGESAGGRRTEDGAVTHGGRCGDSWSGRLADYKHERRTEDRRIETLEDEDGQCDRTGRPLASWSIRYRVQVRPSSPFPSPVPRFSGLACVCAHSLDVRPRLFVQVMAWSPPTSWRPREHHKYFVLRSVDSIAAHRLLLSAASFTLSL